MTTDHETKRNDGPIPSVGEIAQRAYELFERRGRKMGRELDDWLEAERELTGRHPPHPSEDWRLPVGH